MSHGKMGHTQPPSIYLSVLLSLFVLTGVTVAAANFDFGIMNNVVAIGIASVKASLVIWYFMHGRYEDRVTWIFIYFPIFLLLLMIGFSILDYGARPEGSFDVPAKSVVMDGAHHAETDTHGSDAHPDASHDSGTSHAEASHSEKAAGHATPSASAWSNIPGDAEQGLAKAKVLCSACHIVGGAGNVLPGAPPLEESAVADHVNPDYLRKWLKDPAAIKPGTIMPNLGLADRDIENLIAYMHALRK